MPQFIVNYLCWRYTLIIISNFINHILLLNIIVLYKHNNIVVEIDYEKTRKKGYINGVTRVGLLKQVVNYTQCFVK